MTKIKTTRVTYQEFTAENFHRPAKYCVRTADGSYLYVHCRERGKAEEWAKVEFGGKYMLRVG